MAISIAGTSAVNPTGFVDVTPTNGVVSLASPSELVIGHYYVIVMHFQGLNGSNNVDVIQDGWSRLVKTEMAVDRAIAVHGIYIDSQTTLDSVASTPIEAGASSTRVVAIGMAMAGVYHLNPLVDVGAVSSSTTQRSSASVDTVSGSLQLTISATNTSSYQGGTNTTSTGGAQIADYISWTTTSHSSSSSTSLALYSGAVTAVSYDAPAASSTVFQLALMAVSDVPPVGNDPEIGDRLSTAPIENQPVITYQSLTSSQDPHIAGSDGWLRERRVGESETIPGGNQSSTADLDVNGSSRFSYPGTPSASGHGANPTNYVFTSYKPGGAAQNARWLFSVSFVARNTKYVEIRLRAGSTDPTLGRVYVDGQPISDYSSEVTGITAGSGYSAMLEFPSVGNRIITIYGLNGTSGSFGGVAVGPGGQVTKPQALPAEKRVAFIGDSFVNGAHSPPDGAGVAETFVWRLGWEMGATEIIQAGIGGTGWVQTIGGDAESTFTNRVDEVLTMLPTTIVFAGGRNDSPGVQTAVEAAIDAAQAGGVTDIYVVPTCTDGQTSVRTEMLDGATAQTVDYVDVYQGSIALGSDGVHPTYAGHQNLADQIWSTMQGSPPDPELDPTYTFPYSGNGVDVRAATYVTTEKISVETGATIDVPSHSVGDLVVIAAVFSSLVGTSSIDIPEGFAIISDRGTSGNRGLVVYGRAILSAADVLPSTVTLTGHGPISRIVGIGLSLIGMSRVDDRSDWVVDTGGAGFMDLASMGAGALSFFYTNTAGPVSKPSLSSSSNAEMVMSRTAWSTASTASSSTVLGVASGEGVIEYTPEVSNTGGFTLLFAPPVAEHDLLYAYEGELHLADWRAVVHNGALWSFEALPYAPSTHTIEDLLSTNPFYIAHRGSGDNWPEHTMKAFRESVNHGMKAIEVSTRRTSDDVFVVHHDATTTRMTGTAYTIQNTPYSLLEPLMNTTGFTDDPGQPEQPIPPLVDVLEAYAEQCVIFIEAKNGDDTFALLDIMDTYADGKKHFVWKQWEGSNAGRAEAASRGYKMWGYFNNADLNQTYLDVRGPLFDYLGVHHSASDAEVRTAVQWAESHGKQVIMWEIHTKADRDRASSLGVHGMMTSNILKVQTASVPV